jgi:benzoylformate decarboxylase
MDRLAEKQGGAPAWPGFRDVSVSTLARGFGCAASTVATHEELLATLDDALADGHQRHEPLLIEVRVEADRSLDP